jgi:hypothetical protein
MRPSRYALALIGLCACEATPTVVYVTAPCDAEHTTDATTDVAPDGTPDVAPDGTPDVAPDVTPDVVTRPARLPTLDFGRGLSYIADPAMRAAAYDAFASRVDVAEAGRDSSQLAALRARNPRIVAFDYQLDLTACFHVGCGASTPLDGTWNTLPESYFLHFAEDTTLRFRTLGGGDAGTVTIPGCPEGTPVTATCRARTFVWGDTRFLFAVGDATLRAFMAARLLAATSDAVRGVFLDEHSHSFSEAMKFGTQSAVMAGGALREYSGLRPGDRALDDAWNADVVGALARYREVFAPMGRFLLPNLSAYITAPASQMQARAAGGVSVEGMWTPDAWDGTDRFFAVLQVLREIAHDGGTVDLYGALGGVGPDAYTAGGYPDAVTRYRMWRLAASHLAQPDGGARGTVYFNPALDIDFAGDPLRWTQQWLPAYEVGLGAPLGPPEVASRTTYTSSRGVLCSAVVLRRAFAHGTVLVRAKDAWNCTDWDDTGAVTIALSTPQRVLQGDGTWGEPVSSVRVRNAEAWILGDGM